MDFILKKNKRDYGPSTVISTRLPNDLLTKIDAAVNEVGSTRNEFVQRALEFALEHMVIVDDEE